MNDKEQAAHQAAMHVKDGMVIGLGTGSTANCFIEELARRKSEAGLNVTTIASSVVSAIKARELGLPMTSIELINRIDLYVDGADEVAPDMTLLKGQGSDLVKEKILAQASGKFLVLVDRSKLVERIGAKFPIPIEVVPFAWQIVKRKLEEMGGKGGLRETASGLAVTSHGSLVLDIEFDPDMDSNALNTILNAMPGVVEHGIFHNLASAIFIAGEGQVEERWQSA